MKKILLIASLPLSLCFPNYLLSDDTDIYSVSTIDIKPNVLIIFDNSGSMATEDVPEKEYDSETDYTSYGNKVKNNVYYKSGSNFNLLFTDIDSYNWKCDTAKDALKTAGYWTGKIKISNNIATCDSGGTNRELRLGNYSNFIQYLDEEELYTTRMAAAKKVIAKLINDNIEKVDFGLMKFNSSNEGGFIVSGCGASKDELIGVDYNPSSTNYTSTSNTTTAAPNRLGAIGAMSASTNTPLSETMADAGLYFAGSYSWFNAQALGYPYGKYSSDCTSYNKNCINYSSYSPIKYRCQKNYIIYMTDGDPVSDDNGKLKDSDYINGLKIPSFGKDGAAYYLDDIAYFLAHNDLLKTGINPTPEEKLKKGETGDFENQTVTTYTIGFKADKTLLKNTATNGGGEYYTANNASTLNEALNNIITSIKNENESFSAAAVPVSRANKAYAGNFVYYGLFQPLTQGNWVGNLKKYGITDLGVIKDANNNNATSNGEIINNAQSYWSSSIDGPSVTKGGTGEKLFSYLEKGSSRNIFTYTGETNILTYSSNNFSTDNINKLKEKNNNLTVEIIGKIRQDNTGEWPLGSFLHSQPIVVHYEGKEDGSNDHSIIYAGANDGMMHCFDDNDGSEKWGFIPQDLLGNIHTLPTATKLQYYVDGSPELYTFIDENDTEYPNKKLLIFGERRGGTNYTALDISDYNSPILKYEINQKVLGNDSEPLGLSWGKPQLCSIGYTEDETYKTKDVFIMSGGYDTNQDNNTPATKDDEGRAIYAIDCKKGSLQNNLNFNANNFSKLTHSIVAVAPFQNPKSRTTTRIYAGDMNGNMFAFRDDIFHRNRDQSLKDKFDGLYDGKEDGKWEQKLRLFSSPGKKIFYPPNILNVYFPVNFTYPATEAQSTADIVKTEQRVGDYVFYGTGDREHPEDTTVLNEFYAIKNNWSWEDSSEPSIQKAYIDTDDGTIKIASNNQTLVGRDSNGQLITSGSQPFIIDVTSDLYQTVTTDEETEKRYKQFTTEAINHPSNKGWYISLVKEDGTLEGEKVVSTPIIYGGVIYFTTYVPDPGADSTDDPCANPGAKGTGYLYAIGVRYGESVMNLDTPSTSTRLDRRDRRMKLSGFGIPPEPVLVIHEGKPTIVTGFDTIEPHFSQSIEQFYWRQLYN